MSFLYEIAVLRNETKENSKILPAPLADEIFEQIPGFWKDFDPKKTNSQCPPCGAPVTYDTQFTLVAEKFPNDEYDVKLQYEISDDEGESHMKKGMSYIFVQDPMRNNLATAAIGTWAFMKMCQHDFAHDYVINRIPDESTKVVFSSHKWPEIQAQEIVWDFDTWRISVEDKKQKIIKCCTAEEADKILSAYVKCNFDMWDNEYYEPVMDGENWYLEFYCKGICTRQIRGINGYPENWKDFLYFINLCKKIAKKKD